MVDGTSSRADVLRDLGDNASYRSENSLDKAKAFLNALNVWKFCHAFDESDKGPSKVRFDQINRTLSDDIKRVEQFIDSYPTTDPTKAYSGYSMISIEDNGRN